MVPMCLRDEGLNHCPLSRGRRLHGCRSVGHCGVVRFNVVSAKLVGNELVVAIRWV